MTAPALDTLSRLGRAAVRYAEQGWAVFPLVPRGKVPLLKGGGGFLGATADPAQVAAWWQRHPQANIGLAPGPSGLCVFDLDGPAGEATAMALGLLAEPTLVCVTGREDGGRHCYFRRPEFAVPNVALGEKLDVRCDGGYVVLPPSVHPLTHAIYRWAGTFAEVRDLPARALGPLSSAADAERVRLAGPRGPATTPTQRAAREIVLEPTINEGGRNNELTRYAGRLLGKGIPEDETLTIVHAVNATRCKPPLPVKEVTSLVASIAAAEQRKRDTQAAADRPLALVRSGAPAAAVVVPKAEPDLPTPAELAATQLGEARALLARDLSTAPRWAWPDLAALAGPMLPGDMLVVGSLMGNGKSTLLMSQMDAWAAAGVPVLYVPLEVDPAICRVRWAAWKLGLESVPVIRQDWDRLPEGSRDAVDGVLEELATGTTIQFAPPKRLSLGGLVQWCAWAKRHTGARVVVLDHLHRLDFGADGPSYRVGVTEVVRRLKDMARELDMVLLAAAQLNRSGDLVDRYVPPQLSRLKESAGIAEEADVVLMLSRALKRVLPEKWHAKLKLGQITERELAEPNTMHVMCRKHRLDDSALDRFVRLAVANGRVESMAPTWRVPPDEERWIPRYEREGDET